jgi:hypothetical protein
MNHHHPKGTTMPKHDYRAEEDALIVAAFARSGLDVFVERDAHGEVTDVTTVSKPLPANGSDAG